jgi:hypothetical protein
MPAIDIVVADALDQATDGYISLGQVSEHLTCEAGALDPASYDHEHLAALRAAACFQVTADGTFHGDFAGNGAAPWPRTLDQVSPHVLEVWLAYAGRARSAGMRAHLYDLLTSAGFSPPYAHARQAIEAYREAVPEFLAAEDTNRGRLRAAESLIRALGLAAQMNQRDLRDRVVSDILALADVLLGADAVPYRLVYRLLEALHARRLELDAVRSLIERAGDMCDVIMLKVAFLRLLRMMDPDSAAQKGIDRRSVTAMIADADRSTGALRLLTLSDAATVARDAGLTDLFQDAMRKIQAMNRDDLGLAALGGVRVQLTQQELDAARAAVDQASSLAEALWQIAAASAPAGDVAFAQQAAKSLMRTAPLTASIPRGRINPVGPVPVSPASSDPLADTLARFQVLNLHRRGLAITVQLDRVRERFDPDEGDLTAVLAHDAIGSPSKTSMLVHVFQHFWAGQDAAAVHLALPRVEDLLREIERSRNGPVVSVAQGRTPGGMSQLGALIAAMPAAGFDQNWTRSFELLLTDGEHGGSVEFAGVPPAEPVQALDERGGAQRPCQQVQGQVVGGDVQLGNDLAGIGRRRGTYQEPGRARVAARARRC